MELTQEWITQFNKKCAEFLGASITEKDNEWYVTTWKKDLDVIRICNIEMWGTKEETYSKLLSSILNTSYGEWGKFHSDWNWIMEVVEKIESSISFSL